MASPRVALFATCLVDAVVPAAAIATCTLLRRLGVVVEAPASQSCCGQMHANSGYPTMAADLIRHHLDTFERYDAIVTPSGSCGASIRHQHHDIAMAHGDASLARRAADLGARTYELSEYLTDVLRVVDVGAWFPHRVTYHASCHSLRVLRVADRPARLLRHVEAIDLVELPNVESCCGFGGTFALKNADVSAAILADKIDAIESTGASVCTSLDASCLLHIGGGLSRLRTAARAVHLAEILASTRAEPWVP